MDNVILFHTCEGCGGLYGTMVKSRPHECPICGHVDHMLIMLGGCVTIQAGAELQGGISKEVNKWIGQWSG